MRERRTDSSSCKIQGLPRSVLKERSKIMSDLPGILASVTVRLVHHVGLTKRSASKVLSQVFFVTRRTCDEPLYLA